MKRWFFLTGLLASCASMPQSKSPPPATVSLRKVVLVHGFLETGTSFNPLKKRLEKRGFACIVPKLRPSDGRGGLENIAQGLKRDIEAACGPDEEIDIVGFSMGGLVSRYYLQELGGAKRCRNLITIASPHHGTQTAWLYPSKGAIQMRPGSEFLSSLKASEPELGKIPVVSYRTRLDLVILPSTNSIWERADNVEHPSLLHPFLLTNPVVMRDIEDRLTR